MEQFLPIRPRLRESLFWLLIKDLILQEMFSRRRLKASMYISMGHIFSILIIRKFGILLIGLLNLTDLLIHR